MGPWRITFDTNPDHCNFKCVMCECFSPFSKVKETRIEKRVMNMSLIEKVLREAKSMGVKEVIPSTMGEPLLYKEFDKIIDLCHELSLKLNLTTNGSWPIKGVETWATRILPITSDIKISWNGSTSKTHESIMIGSKWNQAIDNLKTLLRIRDNYALQGINRSNITLQLTFMASNIDEVPGLIRLAIDLGVDRIKGHHLWAHFDEIKYLSLKHSQENIAIWNKVVQESLEIAATNFLPNGKSIILEHFTSLDPISNVTIPPEAECPFLGKEAWVNAEGDFNPCCAPDTERKSLGYFGNLNHQSLKEIWASKTYEDLKQNYMQYSLCQQCNMRKVIS